MISLNITIKQSFLIGNFWLSFLKINVLFILKIVANIDTLYTVDHRSSNPDPIFNISLILQNFFFYFFSPPKQIK